MVKRSWPIYYFDCERLEPDDRFPNAIIEWPNPRKFPTLAAAKEFADRRIERWKAAGAVIEVKKRNGYAKYRVERDSNGQIRRTALV